MKGAIDCFDATSCALEGPKGSSRAANMFLRPSYTARGVNTWGAVTV